MELDYEEQRRAEIVKLAFLVFQELEEGSEWENTLEGMRAYIEDGEIDA